MDYANGKIYVILNHINDLVYVGSTTQSLSKRFSAHKGNMKNKRKCNYEIYIAFEELGIQNFYIELLEVYPCSSKDELHKREGQYIRKFDSYKNGYNMRISGRGKKEYTIDTKESKKEYDKERRKIKYHCDCGSVISKAHKSEHLKTIKHKKYIDEQQKLLYIVNI